MAWHRVAKCERGENRIEQRRGIRGLNHLDGRPQTGAGLAPVAAQPGGAGKRQQRGPIARAQRIEGRLRRHLESCERWSLDAQARIQREQHADWNIRDGGRLDLLNHALVEQLEVVGSETGNRPAAFHYQDVYTDDIHAGPESLLALHVAAERQQRRRAAPGRTDGRVEGECASHTQATALSGESRFRPGKASRSNPARTTWGASIPGCVGIWQHAGRTRRGDRLLLTSFGAGYVAAGAYLRWWLPEQGSDV